MVDPPKDNLNLPSAGIKIISIGLIFGLGFLYFSGYMAYRFMGETRAQRLDHLKQTVQIARNTIEPILIRCRSREISKTEARDQIRNIIRKMVYTDHTGQNYIFMSAYDGTMLVQPFEPDNEMQNKWDLKDFHGVYIIRALVDAAKSGKGYVSYHYKRPGLNDPEEKISFVIGIPELDCYIGTGQYMTDLRKSQRAYIKNTVLLSAALLILLFVLVRSSMGEIRRQNLMLHRENESLKTAEKALRNSEKKYRELLEQSPIGLALARMDGRFVSINPAYSKIIGYSMEEALNLSFWDITPEKYNAIDRQMMDQIASDGKYGPYEKEYVHKDGQLVPVRLSGMVVVREDEKFIWSSVEDISALVNAEKERNRLEEKLRQSHKMEAIGTLAGGIAHDFNNILFPILGHTEMLMADVDKNSEFHKRLRKIYDSSLRAKDLVKQILTFSRQEKTEYKLLRVQSIIKEALKLLRSSMPATIDIKQNIQTDCSPVKADPTQIHQIIMNLSANAYHAMEKTGGELNVSLKEIEIGRHDRPNPELEPGSYVCLTVSDQGVGMDKNLIQKIFDPFFTTKEKGKGTGMGLSVVHGIVKNMKGAIQVSSEPGKGTTFTVYFPSENISFTEQQHYQEQEPARGGNESILLVDDENYIIEMERAMLERMGYTVSSWSSSGEALEAFRANPDQFDLVITDMAMPKLSGHQLAADLIKIRPDIPVLLLTGFSEMMSEEQAALCGIKGFLLKPVIMRDLARKVRELLDATGVQPGKQ
ncbi:MAG: cache domain-containing protein [Desulfobacteraceae bacterium]|nr:cache domain-containing protein [Desulfobacteraceae bacterium]